MLSARCVDNEVGCAFLVIGSPVCIFHSNTHIDNYTQPLIAAPFQYNCWIFKSKQREVSTPRKGKCFREAIKVQPISVLILHLQWTPVQTSVSQLSLAVYHVSCISQANCLGLRLAMLLITPAWSPNHLVTLNPPLTSSLLVESHPGHGSNVTNLYYTMVVADQYWYFAQLLVKYQIWLVNRPISGKISELGCLCKA